MESHMHSQYQRKTKLSLENQRDEEEDDRLSAAPPSPRSVRTLEDEDDAAHHANRNVDLERGPPPAYSPRDAQDSKPPTPGPGPLENVEIDDRDVDRDIEQPYSPTRRNKTALGICCGGCCGLLTYAVAIQILVFAVVISRAEIAI